MVIGDKHMEHPAGDGPLAACSVHHIPLRGGDAPQDRREPVRHGVALRIAPLGVINHVQRGAPPVAGPHLLGVAGGGHRDIEVTRLEPLLDLTAVDLNGGRKSGVDRKAHAVKNAVKTDFRHGTPPAKAPPAFSQ